MESEKPTKKYKLKPERTDTVETTERVTIQAKHIYTESEKREIAGKMAQRQIELVEKNDEKKTVMASFADALKRINLDISKLSRGYRDGWDFRDYECVVVYDYANREKLYKDAYTGEIRDRRPFAPGDEQRKISI